jgi:hypothetical protein
MDVSSPPQYRRFSRPGSNELPPYSRCNTIAQPLRSPPREPTEHVFQVADGKSKPWIKLTLRSSAKSAKSLPTFFEKENINGQLELDAERGDSIQAITAHVRPMVLCLDSRVLIYSAGNWTDYHWLYHSRLFRLPKHLTTHMGEVGGYPAHAIAVARHNFQQTCWPLRLAFVDSTSSDSHRTYRVGRHALMSPSRDFSRAEHTCECAIRFDDQHLEGHAALG